MWKRGISEEGVENISKVGQMDRGQGGQDLYQAVESAIESALNLQEVLTNLRNSSADSEYEQQWQAVENVCDELERVRNSL